MTHRETLAQIRELLKPLIAQQVEHKALLHTPHNAPTFSAACLALAEKHTGKKGSDAIWAFGWHTGRAWRISILLTCHRDLRGKPANHGIAADQAWVYAKTLFKLEQPVAVPA